MSEHLIRHALETLRDFGARKRHRDEGAEALAALDSLVEQFEIQRTALERIANLSSQGRAVCGGGWRGRSHAEDCSGSARGNVVKSYQREMQDVVLRLQEENQRLLEQLEAMRPYVQHKPTCLLNVSRSVLRELSWCDCGLREIVAASNPASRPKPEPIECDGSRYCQAEKHLHGCFAERSPARSPDVREHFFDDPDGDLTKYGETRSNPAKRLS